MELFDTHCHIQSVGSKVGEAITRAMWAKAAITDPDAVIDRAHQVGVRRLVCVGCDLNDSRLATEFVRSRAGCWASIGIHPHESGRYAGNAAALQAFTELAEANKVVAIGECGLDYHYNHSPKKAQITLLRFQIELAITQNLPLIFHVRDAFEDFWPIFKEYASSHRLHAVLHSFTDSRAHLERALSHGLYIGVNGIATFAKNPEQLAMYRHIPLDNLVLETDAPFLTPSPKRSRICEPYHIMTIAEFLAGHREMSVNLLTETTTRNARQLFGV